MNIEKANSVVISKRNQNFIDNVKVILEREERNMSWLCKKTDLDSATISRILKGAVTPSFLALDSIADALGVELGWLMAEHMPGAVPLNELQAKKIGEALDDLGRNFVAHEKKLDVLMAKLSRVEGLCERKK